MGLRREDLSAIFMGMIPLRSPQFPAVACERGREGGVGGLGRGAFGRFGQQTPSRPLTEKTFKGKVSFPQKINAKNIKTKVKTKRQPDPRVKPEDDGKRHLRREDKKRSRTTLPPVAAHRGLVTGRQDGG